MALTGETFSHLFSFRERCKVHGTFLALCFACRPQLEGSGVTYYAFKTLSRSVLTSHSLSSFLPYSNIMNILFVFCFLHWLFLLHMVYLALEQDEMTVERFADVFLKTNINFSLKSWTLVGLHRLITFWTLHYLGTWQDTRKSSWKDNGRTDFTTDITFSQPVFRRKRTSSCSARQTTSIAIRKPLCNSGKKR